MCIEELTKKTEESIGKSTHEERVARLRAANIIDDSGYLHSDYFSADTVKKDCEQGNPVHF